jgi:hypothetical protein
MEGPGFLEQSIDKFGWLGTVAVEVRFDQRKRLGRRKNSSINYKALRQPWLILVLLHG